MVVLFVLCLVFFFFFFFFFFNFVLLAPYVCFHIYSTTKLRKMCSSAYYNKSRKYLEIQTSEWYSKNMHTKKCQQQPSFINQPEAEFLKQATLVVFR